MQLTRRQTAAGIAMLGLGLGAAKGDDGVTRKTWGRAPDGTPLSLYTLRNRNGLSASVSTYGAVMTSLVTPDRAGRMGDVVLGFDSVGGYAAEGTPMFGALVGRYANRIGHGRFTLDGKTYQLGLNAGPHNMHGGFRGWNKYVWAAQAAGDASGPGLELTLVSPDGDQGFPGKVTVTAVYRLRHDNRLQITCHARTDAPTVVSMTDHSYFNLAADPSRNVLDTKLQIFADRYTPKDDTGLPTGEIAPVTGTALDFHRAKPIGRDIGAFPDGYDHNFVLDGPERGGLRKAAFAHDPRGGRTLELWTDQPGLQLYTAHSLNTVGKDGVRYGSASGFCLEPQHFPDSPNRPQFPSTVLRPGQLFTWRSEYRFGAV